MTINWKKTDAAIWRMHKKKLRAVKRIDPIGLDDLVGIDRQKHELVMNTEPLSCRETCQSRAIVGSQRYREIIAYQSHSE